MSVVPFLEKHTSIIIKDLDSSWRNGYDYFSVVSYTSRWTFSRGNSKRKNSECLLVIQPSLSCHQREMPQEVRMEQFPSEVASLVRERIEVRPSRRRSGRADRTLSLGTDTVLSYHPSAIALRVVSQPTRGASFILFRVFHIHRTIEARQWSLGKVT